MRIISKLAVILAIAIFAVPAAANPVGTGQKLINYGGVAYSCGSNPASNFMNAATSIAGFHDDGVTRTDKFENGGKAQMDCPGGQYKWCNAPDVRWNEWSKCMHFNPWGSGLSGTFAPNKSNVNNLFMQVQQTSPNSVIRVNGGIMAFCLNAETIQYYDLNKEAYGSLAFDIGTYIDGDNGNRYRCLQNGWGVAPAVATTPTGCQPGYFQTKLTGKCERCDEYVSRWTGRNPTPKLCTSGDKVVDPNLTLLLCDAAGVQVFVMGDLFNLLGSDACAIANQINFGSINDCINFAKLKGYNKLQKCAAPSAPKKDDNKPKPGDECSPCINQPNAAKCKLDNTGSCVIIAECLAGFTYIFNQGCVPEQPNLVSISQHNLMQASRWIGTEGDVNTKRMVVDSAVGIAFGALGGYMVNSLMTSSQLDEGFENVQCQISGTTVSTWGDTFTIGPR